MSTNVRVRSHSLAHAKPAWTENTMEISPMPAAKKMKRFQHGSSSSASSTGLTPSMKMDLSLSEAPPVRPYGVSIKFNDKCITNTKKMDKIWGVQSDDVHDLMRERESLHRPFDPHAKWIKYRRVLVDWMCEAGDEFDLYLSTMHVSVMFLDRVLHKVTVPRNKLQLVAIACILIAAKFEETEEKVPTLPEMNRYAQWAFDPDQIYKMEVMVLRTLNWCLGTHTPLHFTGYYLSKGVLFMPDKMQGRALVKKVPSYLKRYVEFFADLCLQDYKFQEYTPSLMGAAIIMASRCALGILPIWRKELETLTKYPESEVEPCFKAIWACYRENFPTAPAGAEEEVENNSPTSVVSGVSNAPAMK